MQNIDRMLKITNKYLSLFCKENVLIIWYVKIYKYYATLIHTYLQHTILAIYNRLLNTKHNMFGHLFISWQLLTRTTLRWFVYQKTSLSEAMPMSHVSRTLPRKTYLISRSAMWQAGETQVDMKTDMGVQSCSIPPCTRVLI